MKNTCTNCLVYNWKQKEGKVTLRCSGCKIFFYCSKECQEEHWRKTHRRHCKHLAQLKAGEHNSKQDLDSELELLSLATKDPGDRTERILKVMQKLLAKIKLTKHSAAETVEIEQIAKNLSCSRAEIYVKRLKNPKEVCQIDINKIFKIPEIRNESATFKTWETLNALRGLLLQLFLFSLDQLLKSPEKCLPSEFREASRKVRDGSFLRIIDKILEALEDEGVPHSELINIVCEGNLERSCSVCQREITVSRVWSPGFKTVGAASVCLYPLEGVIFVCGTGCNLWDRMSLTTWISVLGSTVNRLRPTRCDFCFLCAPLQEVHRSLCKTKNYCSKVCRKADDDFHKVCCEQGLQVDERKVKIGGQAKVEAADAAVKDGLKRSVSEQALLLECSSKLLNSRTRDFEEGLRHQTNLMMKIELKEERKLKDAEEREFNEVD